MNLPQEKESDIEKYCNSFAAELLLPMEILEDEFGKKRKDINCRTGLHTN
jgi:Zn-dependent peptidase ImmA (M78 family)